MWYLNRGHRLDMNVQDAWLQGATGEGISVTILDDGIEKSHPDIVANYDPLASYDVNQNDNDPTPRYDLIDSNRHGKTLILMNLFILSVMHWVSKIRNGFSSFFVLIDIFMSPIFWQKMKKSLVPLALNPFFV